MAENSLGKKKGLTAHEERVRIEGITERLKQKKKDTIKLRQQLKGIEVEPDNPLIQSQDQGIGTRPVEQEIEPLVESTDITTPQSPTGLGSPITSIGRGALRKAPLVALGVRGFAEAQKRFPETFSAIETELYEPLDLGLGRDEYPSGFEGGLAWAENLFGQAIKSGKDLLGIEDESKTLPRASSISSFSPKKILSKKGLGSRTLDENLLKGVLKREDGEPVVVYRGSESSEDQNIMNKIVRGEGRVDAWDDSGLAFFSDNPHVAESFAGSEGVMAPFLIKPKEVIEFKLRYLRGLGGERLSDDPFFDKLAFDKRASQLGKGQVLVARDVVDTGPRTAYRGEDPRYLTYGSDIYAMTDPDILVSAISPQEASKDDPDVPDIAALQQRIDELANEWKDKHPHIDAEREFDARQAKDEVEETRRFRDLFNRSYGERKEIAAWTDERLRSAIRTVEHGANIETKGQIGFVDPLDFLTATSSGQDAGRIMEEAGALDEARLKDETQTPYIVVENSAIIGHEGRHRMIAMARAGVSRVPILIKHRGLDDYTNFEFQEYQTFLSEEFFDGIRGGLDLTVTNLHSADSSQFGAIKEDIASHAAGIEFVVGGLITKQKNFQSGGLNMARTEEEVYDDTEDQMDMMGFEPQEQSIDPVSGNEVPLGGTAEGVRDDIDVKMSKGEMVIPEYAVNYHGVETYVDSIQKAQRGYDQMKDMGLVGNPDEAIMDQSEPLPKMEENDTLEFQAGGYVDGVNTIPRTHGGESLAYISPEEASYLREIGGGVPTNNPSGQITKFGIPSFEAPNWVTNQAYKLPGSRMHYVYQQALAARRDPSSAHYRQPATKLGIQGQHGGSVAPAPVAEAESVPVSPSAAPQTPYVSPSARRFRPRLSEQDRTIRTAPLQSFSNLAPANFGGLASAPHPTIPTPTISPPVTEDISTVDGPLRPVSTQPTPTLSPYPSGYFIEIEGQPNMFKFVAPPGQQNTLTGTYTREQVGNAPIAPAGTTPESVYGPQFQTYAPSYTLQNVPSTGGYEVIPYTNAEGDTIYMTSVNGQIQGTVPQGYSPSVEEDGLEPQMEQPVQAPVVSEKPFVPPGGYPTGPLGGGVGVTPPSVTPTTVSPALSAENQATVQSIQTAMKSQGILGGDVVSEADIVSQTAPHAAINVPLADTPLGNISTLDVVSAAVKVATKLAGFPSVVGQAAIGIPMALAFHKNQTATAQMQAKLGIEGAAFDPVTGWSFHKTESLFGKLALVAYNKFDVTSLRNASDVMRTDLAMRFNADFTGMTNTEIYKAQRKDENGVLIGFDAPKGQINNSKTGMHLSDGTFYSHRFKTISDSSSLGDFQALSPEIQARNWAIRNSKWYRTNPIMTDAAKTIHNKNVSFVKDMYPTLVEDSSEFKNMVASVAKNPSASKQISFSKAAVKRQANLSGTKRRSSTPGFGGTTGKAKGKSTGTGAFCWVARKVYGEDNPKWQIFRSWLCTQAPKWLYKAYGKYGESFAEWLDGKERTQKIIRKWMDKRIQKYLDTQPKTAQEIGPL